MNYIEREKEKIIEELIKENKIRPGQLIDYKYFKEIYEPYKEKMDEKTFAELLGITYPNYMNMKHNGRRVKVNDYRIKEKIDRIKYIIKREIRYYTKEEIENICKEFDIGIDILLQYLCCKGREEFVTNFRDILEKKGKVWIGQTECSREFANKYSKAFIAIANKNSKIVCKKYGFISEQQDIASDALEDMLYKWGDIEKNFGDNDNLVKKLISTRTYLNMEYKCLEMLRKPREYSFHRTFTSKDSEEELNVFDKGIKGNSINVQEEAEMKILKEIKEKQAKSPEEVCIDLLKEYIELGLNMEESIKRTGEALGISPEEMLETLQKYMIEQKRVRKTASGNFIMGEL